MRSQPSQMESALAIEPLAVAAPGWQEPVPAGAADAEQVSGDEQDVKKGSWTPEEDRLLTKLVKLYGTRNWTIIANGIRGRSGKSCRLRWHNQLDPTVIKSPFTDLEDAVIVKAHDVHGNKWAAIAKLLPGRTDNGVKNHWNATLKRKVVQGTLRNRFLKEGHTLEALLEMMPPPAPRAEHADGSGVAGVGSGEGEELTQEDLELQAQVEASRYRKLALKNKGMSMQATRDTPPEAKRMRYEQSSASQPGLQHQQSLVSRLHGTAESKDKQTSLLELLQALGQAHGLSDIRLAGPSQPLNPAVLDPQLQPLLLGGQLVQQVSFAAPPQQQQQQPLQLTLTSQPPQPQQHALVVPPPAAQPPQPQLLQLLAKRPSISHQPAAAHLTAHHSSAGHGAPEPLSIPEATHRFNVLPQGVRTCLLELARLSGLGSPAPEPTAANQGLTVHSAQQPVAPPVVYTASGGSQPLQPLQVTQLRVSGPPAAASHEARPIGANHFILATGAQGGVQYALDAGSQQGLQLGQLQRAAGGSGALTPTALAAQQVQLARTEGATGSLTINLAALPASAANQPQSLVLTQQLPQTTGLQVASNGHIYRTTSNTAQAGALQQLVLSTAAAPAAQALNLQVVGPAPAGSPAPVQQPTQPQQSAAPAAAASPQSATAAAKDGSETQASPPPQPAAAAAIQDSQPAAPAAPVPAAADSAAESPTQLLSKLGETAPALMQLVQASGANLTPELSRDLQKLLAAAGAGAAAAAAQPAQAGSETTNATSVAPVPMNMDTS